jgi:Glutaredoxin-like domain (DUF836)
VDAPRRLVVYTREQCPLCDELRLELQALLESRDAASAEVAVEIRNVDVDPVAMRRYGLKVPVLLLDGEPVCHGHLDSAALTRLLAR